MRRLLLYDGFIALVAILIWVVIVVIEVKVSEVWFFKYVFWSSLLLLFFAFPIASLVAFKGKPGVAAVMAVISVFVISPVFIYVGVMLVWGFKIAIGGHK
jgi:hypothetical protein